MKIRLAQGFGKIKIKIFLALYHHFHMHFRGQWPLFLKAFLASLGVVLMEIAQPWPIKIMLDYILLDTVKEGPIAEALKIFEGNHLAEGAALAIVIVLIALLKSQFEYIQGITTAGAGQKIVSAIRVQLYNHIQKLSASFHDRSKSGDLLMRLTGDILMLREMLVVSVLMLLSNLMILVGMITIMFYKDVGMTLIALAVVPLLGFVSFKMTGQITEVSKKQRRKEGKIAALANETIIGIRDIQAFGREKYEGKRFEKQNRASLKEGLKAIRLEGNMNRKVQVILSFGTAMVILFGINRVLGGILTPGDLIVFISYMRGMYRPIRKLAQFSRRFAKTLACGERVLEVLETQPEIKDRPDAIEAVELAGKFEFKKVCFAFAKGRPVLKDIDFTVSSGESVAFVGPSGAGKTTIVNLLLRFYEPQKGNIFIDGRDIRDYKIEFLRNQIATVRQDSLLFGISVKENIAFGKPGASDEKIIRAARKANAHKFIESLPEGYDTVLGERGVTLSGGQIRRIIIARAILKKSPVLLLDEPTFNIDPTSEQEVIDALSKLAADKTVFIISHSYSTVVHADRIFYISNGRIIESGSHLELMRLKGEYYHQYTRLFPGNGVDIPSFFQDQPPHVGTKKA
jgi:ATP-binding cassette, subfamily B, bacterial